MTVLSLGYLRLRSARLDEWATFAANVMGFMPTTGADPASLYFRWDKYPYRLTIVPGDDAGVDAIGYEVADDRALATIAATIEAGGHTVEFGTPDEVAARQVSGLVRFRDPAGTPVELFFGPVLDHVPVVTPLVSGFVTGEMGLGHVVLNVSDITAVSDFYRDVLGFHRRNTWYRPPMSLEFFGCNPTLALGAGLTIPGSLVHFMVEAATIDDVGYAQDRCLDAGVPVRMSIGKHTNDHMISFYCGTPDGFLVEFGWGGIHIDDAESEATYQITRPSFWGHRPLTS
jgi:3,4-dihydroxy-9,10-secoandrosta-1,3,5(10)-triene-9,17-dione 4,5-dioxygenase